MISPAKTIRCGENVYPVLSMTTRNGLMLQSERFKKVIASVDRSAYKVVKALQLVVGFPIDEGVLSIQNVAPVGIVSPAYAVWDVDLQRVEPQYLETALRSERSLQYYRAKLQGSTARRRNLTNADLLDLTLSLPSMTEQKRIVAKLAAVAATLKKRQPQLGELDALVEARFVELFGDLQRNTKDLPLFFLSELGVWASGGTPSRSCPEYFRGDVDWFTAGELNNLFLTSSIEKITRKAIENSSAKIFVKNSLLIGMYDTAAFKMGILTKAASSNQACACITPNSTINAIWLYYALQAMKSLFLLERRGVRQKNLSLQGIKKFQLPVPPLESQERFAAEVEQIEAVKGKVRDGIAETQTL
ncbi:MAG: restriction endonuclease subunit S, partial [Thermoguttaceae bacterium]|nr:restriction endonuclease subunit S [Thermoguttaceae bacterium]